MSSHHHRSKSGRGGRRGRGRLGKSMSDTGSKRRTAGSAAFYAGKSLVFEVKITDLEFRIQKMDHPLILELFLRVMLSERVLLAVEPVVFLIMMILVEVHEPAAMDLKRTIRVDEALYFQQTTNCLKK